MGGYGLSLRRARDCERVPSFKLAALVNQKVFASSLCAVGVLDRDKFPDMKFVGVTVSLELEADIVGCRLRLSVLCDARGQEDQEYASR